MGFALHYFDEVNGSDTWLDYTAINGTSAFARPDASTGFKSLYNGNIGAISMNNAGLLKGAGPNTYAAPLFYKYRYDQLNRLVSMQAYEGLNAATNQWTAISINDYAEAITYDPNGNIKTYSRKGSPKAGQPLEMDALTYHYETGKNRLSYVQDPTPAGNYSQAGNGTVDIDGQSAGNYGYDLIGNLISDAAEGISDIDWNVYGKITSITKSSGTIIYSYDAAGNRVTKAALGVTTIYVRDAGGNVMSVYEKPVSESLLQKELFIYGSKRVGITSAPTAIPSNVSLSGEFGIAIKVTFSRSEKIFELNNHLGNVILNLSDRALQVSSGGSQVDSYKADILIATDYYSFGMVMPGRHYSGNSKYRYGFNGKEFDWEVKWGQNQVDFGARIYDPRLGRFLSVDRLTSEVPFLSPYSSSSNNPICLIDINGDLPGLPPYHIAMAIIKKNTAAFIALFLSNNTSNYYLYAHAKGWEDGKSSFNNLIGAIGESEAYKKLVFDFGVTVPGRSWGIGIPNSKIYFGRYSGSFQIDLQEVVNVYNRPRGLFTRSNSAGIKYSNFDGSYGGVSQYHANFDESFTFKINYEVKTLNPESSVEANFLSLSKGFKQIRDRSKGDHTAAVLVVDEDAWKAVANDKVYGPQLKKLFDSKYSNEYVRLIKGLYNDAKSTLFELGKEIRKADREEKERLQ